jgi:hypothetical protein
MGIAANDSSLAVCSPAELEKQYEEYRARCIALHLASDVQQELRGEENFEIFTLMLQTAKIDAPYQDVSGGGCKSFIKAQIKNFLRWLLRPLVKIALVHQQELNHLVVLLAQSHRVLEKKVAQLEAAGKSAEIRQ